MQTIPETYFSRHLRESQEALLGATDICSRLAHAQLAAAYAVVAASAEPLCAAPRFEYGASATDAAHGYASVTTA